MSVLDYIASKIRSGVIAFVNMVSLANRDYPYHDYHDDTMTDERQIYRVGENQIGRNGDQHKQFVSKSTLILATTNALVTFNNSRNVVQTLLANNYYEFKSNIHMILYEYESAEGTIYIHCEGIAPNEARRPE